MTTIQFNGILHLTVIFFIWSATAATPSSSIYDALSSHGLPMGLFPKGVTNYTLDSSSGWFELHLDQACNAKFESELHYERNVSGRLSYGQIANLTGIAAQELFLWFPVKGIRVDVPSSGLIYFDVGVVFKQFSMSLFESPPDCVAGAMLSPDHRGDEVELEEEDRLISRVMPRSGLRYRFDRDRSSSK